MNYQKIYNNLVLKRQQEPATGYTEKHHIVMRSMGGPDDPSNLVVLTGREHWIAHLLLHKIHRNQRTACACHMMAMNCEERGIPKIKTSRAYEYIRKEHAKYVSRMTKVTQKGKRNSQYGTTWISKPTSKENKKWPKDTPIPFGWLKGRNTWNKNIKKICSYCEKEFYTTGNIKFCSEECKNLGRKIPSWSLETKIEYSKKLKDRKLRAGNKNPCFGKKFKWINNGSKNVRWYDNVEDIPEGFSLGFLRSPRPHGSSKPVR